VASQDLNARRAAMLLRCQEAREKRHRLEVFKAELEVGSAKAVERRAQERLLAHERRQRQEMRKAHDALHGRLVDARELENLAAAELALFVEQAKLTALLSKAREDASKAEMTLNAALAELRAATREMQKRQRLADTAAAAWHHVIEMVEETEQTDQTLDMWRPA
jgi:hypothetical protein